MNKVTSFVRPAAVLALVASLSLSGSTRAETIAPDLGKVPSQEGWKFINRAAALIEKDGAKAIRLDGNGGTGYVRLENVTFADGEIEFDARGQNVVQKSFLGIAFHGQGAWNYDAIYFRPFNFNATDPMRRSHAVQYVSMPGNPWQKLRTAHPGKYESAIAPVPDPDGWFHVRVVVASPKVSVFVNGAARPCLVVDQLANRPGGWVGLWVDVKGGDFANLKITPAAPAAR